jgi:hypothetical protein
MNPHLHPWTLRPEGFPQDGFPSDRLAFLLGYAILAPSPHNTQPWQFRLNYHDLEVLMDPRRLLHISDPLGREATMAVGAALFHLRVAAEYFGFQPAIAWWPDPAAHPEVIARFALGPQTETTSEDVVLFQAITARRTNRATFRPDPIPKITWEALATAARTEGAELIGFSDPDPKMLLADLVARADRMQWANRAFRAEFSSWLRPDADHRADGMAVGDIVMQDWLAVAGPFWVRTFDRGSRQAATDREIAQHSPTLAVLITDGDDTSHWLAAGQAMARVLLTAQAEGVAVSHLNPPIEVPDYRVQVGQLTGRTGFPQLLLRLGYAPPAPPTPRRSVSAVLLRQDPSQAPPH